MVEVERIGYFKGDKRIGANVKTWMTSDDGVFFGLDMGSGVWFCNECWDELTEEIKKC